MQMHRLQEGEPPAKHPQKSELARSVVPVHPPQKLVLQVSQDRSQERTGLSLVQLLVGFLASALGLGVGAKSA